MRVLVVSLLLLCLTAPAMAADNLKEMFANGTFKGKIELLHFTRDFDGGNTDRQDQAAGGVFYYKTDSFKGITLGGALATTNDLNSDDDKATYGLLAGGHESVTRLQEYYVQGDYFDTTVKIGAQELFTPFLFFHPVRMMPRTFRGASVVNKSVDNLKLMAFYLEDAADWDDDAFVNMSQIAGPIYANDGSVDDEAAIILGASYNLPIDGLKASVEAWGFKMDDVINQYYLKTKLSKKINDITVFGGMTYADQQDDGDALSIRFGDGETDIDTFQFGVNAGVAAYGFNFTAMYSKTGDDPIYDPWGYSKAIIQQVLNAGLLADEDAYGAKLSYNFGRLGVNGLSAYVFHAEYDGVEAVSRASVDSKETDFNVQYAFSGGLEGLGLRVRHAIVDNYYGKGFDAKDTRFFVTYKF